MKLDREAIRRKLPQDLDEIAKDTGALLRRREVKCAEQLLWMALIYSGLAGPLRGTSALGVETGDFDLNDTSVRYRLRQSVEFLTEVLNHLLFGAARASASKGLRRRICLQDATVVSIPGSTGTGFRLHTEYIPGQGLAYVEITGSEGGEHLKRGEYKPGDIVIADQGLGHASSIHHVVSTGAYVLVRVYLQNLKLHDAKGGRLVVEKILDRADRGVSSMDVYVPLEDKESIQARLVMLRLPAEQAARARQRLKKRASKKQKTITDQAMRLAGYIVLLTTVPQSELSEEEVLRTYRLRWQIELFFKRCKSLMGLDELQAGGRLAQSWLLGKMIIAALIDRAIASLQAASPDKRSVAPANLWRLTKLCLIELDAAIHAVERGRLALGDEALDRLKEGDRRRKTAAPQIDALYRKLNPGLRKRRA